MDAKKLYRSRSDQMIAGVCGGLGQYLNIDPTLIRLIFVLLVLFGVGSGLLIYLALMIVVPLEPEPGPDAPRSDAPAPDAAPDATTDVQ